MQLWAAPWVQPGAEPWELPWAEPQAEPLASTLSAHAQAFTPVQGQDTSSAAPTMGPTGGEDPTTDRAAVLAPDAAAAGKPRMAPPAELPLPSPGLLPYLPPSRR